MKLEDVPNIVLVASGKGGVGKTTVSSDFARAAAEEVGQVGFIDADISTPNSAEVLGGEDVDLEGQRLSTGDSIVPPVVEGVQLVSQGIILPDGVPVLRGAQWRAEVVADYVQNVEWHEDTELVVIDSPPGSGEELQTVAAAVPLTHAYVVTTPHGSSVRDAKKTHEFFKQAEVPHDVITNMAKIPGQEVLDHVTGGADFTEINGVGDETDARIREILVGECDDLPLFGYDDGEPVDIGADHVLTLPYTEDAGARREALMPEVRDLLGPTEVKA